ncbi:hypothetical protein NL676_018800 [Syzygium grande]|nr:hypothetical protein NL676_018800 [Syzygium grande]
MFSVLPSLSCILSCQNVLLDGFLTSPPIVPSGAEAALGNASIPGRSPKHLVKFDQNSISAAKSFLQYKAVLHLCFTSHRFRWRKADNAMGDVLSKAANSVSSVVGNALAAPFKTIFGGSCE